MSTPDVLQALEGRANQLQEHRSYGPKESLPGERPMGSGGAAKHCAALLTNFSNRAENCCKTARVRRELGHIHGPTGCGFNQ